MKIWSKSYLDKPWRGKGQVVDGAFSLYRGRSDVYGLSADAKISIVEWNGSFCTSWVFKIVVLHCWVVIFIFIRRRRIVVSLVSLLIVDIRCVSSSQIWRGEVIIGPAEKESPKTKLFLLPGSFYIR